MGEDFTEQVQKTIYNDCMKRGMTTAEIAEKHDTFNHIVNQIVSKHKHNDKNEKNSTKKRKMEDFTVEVQKTIYNDCMKRGMKTAEIAKKHDTFNHIVNQIV